MFRALFTRRFWYPAAVLTYTAAFPFSCELFPRVSVCGSAVLNLWLPPRVSVNYFPGAGCVGGELKNGAFAVECKDELLVYSKIFMCYVRSILDYVISTREAFLSGFCLLGWIFGRVTM